VKILVALTRFPWPVEKGDKLRAFMQIRGLAERHEVHLVCLAEYLPSEDEKKMLEPYCASITVISHSAGQKIYNLLKALFNSLPFQVNYYRNSSMKEAIRNVIKEKQIDVVLVQFIRLDLNIPFGTGKPFFLDYQDCLSLGMENRLPEAGFFEKILIRKEARRLRKYESDCSKKYHGLGIISAQDAQAIKVKGKNRITVIPNGVNEIFLESKLPAGEKKYDILFTGNLGYYPNIKAAEYIVKEILPELKAKGLEMRVCLAGARPSREVLSLASEKVTVTGYVDDLREYYLQSGIFVAPLFSGSGLQNKLLESMAMGIATVTTPLCNAALQAPEGKAILVCENPRDFAEKIEWLFYNKTEAERLGKCGTEFIRENYLWEKANRVLEKALTDLL
jgi:glycosyltransferase involved in cell wall biosynthesis